MQKTSFKRLNTTNHGFTLIELMVTISIAAVIATIALPNLNTFITKMRVDNEISQLYRLLLLARNTAVNYQQNVVVCPLNNTSICTSDWHKEISVFIDDNNDKIFTPSDEELIIRIKDEIKAQDKLQYGLGRTQILFEATGRTHGWGANGTFKYCPKEGEEYARGIVVSTSGRFYASSDINNDGIDEVRSGAQIKCRN
jgi:type IV fimbrial biogenesis protein FimT